MDTIMVKASVPLYFLLILLDVTVQEDVPVYVCDAANVGNSGKEKIYCQGRILEAVNKWKLFDDSKDYVDSALVKSPKETYDEFEKQFPSDLDITKDKLQHFVDTHFYKPESELDHCTPIDWKSSPPLFSFIKDPDYHQFALNLNDIWKQLCRKMNTSLESSSKHSLLYVPYPFIAPGGRFREFYYWDSYWIIKGLLASSMHKSAEYMIRNLASMVEKYGFVPNGGRVYYLKRSQPPLLIPMLYEYFMATRNVSFVKEMINSLTKEMNFWRMKRNVTVAGANGENYVLYRYKTTGNTPRPESWKEDHATGKNETVSNLYSHIQSACESGWDFSSRWFKDKRNLHTIHTMDIIPVDLNAIICWNMDILQLLYTITHDLESKKEIERERSKLKVALRSILYNDTEKAWFDYDMSSKKHNVDFYPSVAVPLFTGCYNLIDTFKTEDLYRYLNKSGALKFPGGIPTSIYKTSQQWDFPNGWPPSNHMIIEGFRKSTDSQMQRDAFLLADRWVQNNYITYKTFNKDGCPCMFEKLNVIKQGIGKGGEYVVQTGFGWTNGVVLDLMITYGSRLEAPPISESSSSTLPLSPLFLINIILVLYYYIYKM